MFINLYLLEMFRNEKRFDNSSCSPFIFNIDNSKILIFQHTLQKLSTFPLNMIPYRNSPHIV